MHLRGSMEAGKVATGGRRGRFRARRDALSVPEHPENNLDMFNFRSTNQLFLPFFLGSGAPPKATLGRPSAACEIDLHSVVMVSSPQGRDLHIFD